MTRSIVTQTEATEDPVPRRRSTKRQTLDEAVAERARTSNFAGIRLAIEYVPVGRLTAAPRAVRSHTREQVRAIGCSIAEFGFVVPITVYGDYLIAAGAARWAAAKLAGWTEVPVVRVEHLTDEQARLLAIADNKLTEGGSWDVEALRLEFDEIVLAAPEIDLDSSGFTIAERDIIVGRHRVDEMADLDVADEPTPGPAVSRLGDVWALGRHRVMCGDATDAATIATVLAGRAVRTMLSDLPYNVKIAGNVSGLGKHKHGEFAMASGEMTRAAFIEFIARAIGAVQPNLVDGALLYLFMDWRHLTELVAASENCGLTQLNLLVWAKTAGAMGSFYRSAHEMIGVFKHGDGRYFNNIALGKYGRNRTNVLNYPGVATFGKGRAQALALHPTVKPVALIADLLLDSSGPGEVILDTFGGSGTTLIAAEKTDRIACLVEIAPAYVDVAVRRFEAAFGVTAIHAETGRTFAETAAERTAAVEAAS